MMCSLACGVFDTYIFWSTCNLKYLKLTSDLTSFTLRFFRRHAHCNISGHNLLFLERRARRSISLAFFSCSRLELIRRFLPGPSPAASFFGLTAFALLFAVALVLGRAFALPFALALALLFGKAFCCGFLPLFFGVGRLRPAEFSTSARTARGADLA